MSERPVDADSPTVRQRHRSELPVASGKRGHLKLHVPRGIPDIEDIVVASKRGPDVVSSEQEGPGSGYASDSSGSGLSLTDSGSSTPPSSPTAALAASLLNHSGTPSPSSREGAVSPASSHRMSAAAAVDLSSAAAAGASPLPAASPLSGHAHPAAPGATPRADFSSCPNSGGPCVCRLVRLSSQKKLTYDPSTAVFSRAEVAKHDSRDDCWIIAGRNVYDVTNFLDHHPASAEAILRHAGTDCTEDFHFHTSAAQKLWARYKIGRLPPAETETCVIL